MAKPRSNVQFQHRGSMSNGKARRPSSSMSNISETGSEPDAPADRNGVIAKSEGEVISTPLQTPAPNADYIHSPKASLITRRRRKHSSPAQYGL